MESTKRSDDKLAQQTDGPWCGKVTDELCNIERGFDETVDGVNEADQCSIF